MKEYLLKPKVHFVAGKGGVGKTMMSQALARYFSDQGHKTLLVSLNEEEEEQAFKSIAKIENIERNLYTVKVRPDQSLYEYLLLKIAKPALITTMLNNTLFRRLCSAMPGLSDLVRLGKIWFHADESHAPAKEMFDKIVVDMPSSGFVARFLSVAQVVESAVKIGPLAKEAGLIERYFTNSEHARIHLVALPKELVVNETVELYKSIKKRTKIALGMLFINRILDFDEAGLHELETKLPMDFVGLRYLADFYGAIVADEQVQIADLMKKFSDIPIQKIDEFLGCDSQADVVKKIMGRIRL